MKKLKVDYISDLHLNHYVRWDKNQIKWEKNTRVWGRTLLQTKQGEVLVIAGDFSEWNHQTLWFLEECAKQYEQVFFVTGNHDYYLLSKTQQRKYGDSKGRQAELLDLASKIPNVQPLNYEVVEYEGKTIAGGSLWYLPKTIADWNFYFGTSNDSTYISVLAAHDGIVSSLKDIPHYLYKEAMDWYDTLQGPFVDLMISHIPPVHPPISTYERNACYDCPVPFLASEKWICGHQHIQGTFEKAGTLFYMNALGYPNENNILTLKTLEI